MNEEDTGIGIPPQPASQLALPSQQPQDIEEPLGLNSNRPNKGNQKGRDALVQQVHRERNHDSLMEKDEDENLEIGEDDEDPTATLSWTSSNVSLSPDLQHFLLATGSTASSQQNCEVDENGEAKCGVGDETDTSHNDNAIDRLIGSNDVGANDIGTGCSVIQGIGVLGMQSALHGVNTNNSNATMQFVYPEDKDGEPIVDESVLKILATSSSHDTADDEDKNHEDDEDDDPVMLGGDETTLSPNHRVEKKPPPTSPSFFPHFQHTLGPVKVNNASLVHSPGTFSDKDDPNGPDHRSNDESMPLFHRHGRLPSTIAEEGCELPAMVYPNEDGDNNSTVDSSNSLRMHHLGPRHSTIYTGTGPRSPPRSRNVTLLHHGGGTIDECSTHPSPWEATSDSLNTDTDDTKKNNPNGNSPLRLSLSETQPHHGNDDRDPMSFNPHFSSTKGLERISRLVLPTKQYTGAATWIGFWAMLFVTCANYVLTPMRDAMALQVGVQHIPKLTLASTVLAVVSSVPIGWLFEAPDPSRRRLWKRMGLTRGETQGTSLALFYRIFAWIVIAYAIGFMCLEWIRSPSREFNQVESKVDKLNTTVSNFWVLRFLNVTRLWSSLGPSMFIAFFLIVHLMKLHCLSLVWGVTTEAMEYEDVAREQYQKAMKGRMSGGIPSPPMESQKMRLKRLSLIGFGGTVGGIMGSFLASTMAQFLRVPGLLLLAAFLLEISAELSIEMGRIMKKHWEGQQQLFQSSNDLVALDPSMHRSSSLGSMKRISSGNSLNRVQSTSDLGVAKSPAQSAMSRRGSSTNNLSASVTSLPDPEKNNEDSFSQRMLRGIRTILRSRLLMAIFTYNALYASTNVLLSFQRAALIAGRKTDTTVQADTAFLANINMASSAAIFALQASGIGATVAHCCGSRGTLTLMPIVRLLGVIALAWWHRISGGQTPNLLVFLVADECCKVMNLAVAKPVRESLWRGLSNEARYEAKPIVDTLANRWGGGSAAFLVSFVDKTLDLFGAVPSEINGMRSVFGFPPVLFLCVVISTWWTVVSADLGHIRMKIDLELKKRQ